MAANFVINPDDKFYPQANVWMWDYCTFLGKFTDSKGNNYDLGIYTDDILKGNLRLSDATVLSDEPGDYLSGEISQRHKNETTYENKLEIYRRLDILNIKY